MSLSVDVRADLRAVTRDLDRVQRREVPRAAATALNRTNKTLRSRFVRELAARLNITPARRVRRRVAQGRRATPDHLATGGLGLFRFVPEIWTLGRGIRARRGAQGVNKFLQTMPGSGYQGLFRRTGSKRLPIAQTLLDRQDEALEVLDQVLASDGISRYRIEFTRALARRLRR